MTLILSGNVASATASTTYNVANSCRFNDADNAHLVRTPGSAGTEEKYTFSFWFKTFGLPILFLFVFSKSCS